MMRLCYSAETFLGMRNLFTARHHHLGRSHIPRFFLPVSVDFRNRRDEAQSFSFDGKAFRRGVICEHMREVDRPRGAEVAPSFAMLRKIAAFSSNNVMGASPWVIVRIAAPSFMVTFHHKCLPSTTVTGQSAASKSSSSRALIAMRRVLPSQLPSRWKSGLSA